MNKYIKYKAYVNLRNKLISKIEQSGVQRPSKLTSITTLVAARSELEEAVPKVTINTSDSFDVIVEKKLSAKENELYLAMVQDAFREYNKVLSLLDRPTVSKIAKELGTVLNVVIDDLLSLEEE